MDNIQQITKLLGEIDKQNAEKDAEIANLRKQLNETQNLLDGARDSIDAHKALLDEYQKLSSNRLDELKVLRREKLDRH